MSFNNNVINPALAKQMMQRGERIKRKRSGKPASLEAFPRVTKTLTGLWGYAECQKFLEELMMVEDGAQRQGFPVDAQEELMFIYELMLDQQQTLLLSGQNAKEHNAPGTKFTMGS